MKKITGGLESALEPNLTNQILKEAAVSNESYIFPPSPVPSVSIVGRSEAYPINRIFCVGRNYHAHALEMGDAVDKTKREPFYFMKDASALVTSGSTIDYPPGTANLHYEMELVVAVGKPGFQIDEANADDYIYGYAAGLDMTRRDLQKVARENGRPWDIAKNFEMSAVLSPIVAKEDIGIVESANIELSLNGEVKQSSNTSLMIWSLPELLAHLSRFYHLQPGDLIYTGTPEGVGAVKSGDRIYGVIEGVAEVELAIK